jgi:hypothetical protein
MRVKKNRNTSATQTATISEALYKRWWSPSDWTRFTTDPIRVRTMIPKRTP